MAAKTYRIEWQGDAVGEMVKAAVKVGLAAWADKHEQAARAQLVPGRGYRTGRLQKSIHAAAPSYDWRSDFVPGRGQELAGVAVDPDENGSVISVAVGSGLSYAESIERLYAMVGRGHDQTIGELDGQIATATKAAGLH